MAEKKHKKTRPIHGEARQIIFNVISFFEKERDSGVYSLPVHHVMERAAAATGTSLSTLRRIRSEGKLAVSTCTEIKTPCAKKRRLRAFQLDVIQHSYIRNIINTFYTADKDTPNVTKILDKVSKDIQFGGSKITLKAILAKELGYKFCKYDVKKSVLFEKPNSMEARTKYLARIRQNDLLGNNKNPVVYIGETWIRCDRAKYGRSQRLYMVHAGSDNGLVPGAQLVFKFKMLAGEQRDKINSKIFLRWLNNKLIPNLPQNCIVVMRSAPYTMVDINRPPKKSSKEPELKKWLHDRNIIFKESMSRLKLVNLCQKHRPPKQYIVDRCLQSRGHEVLRLPPYNNDLNLMEYAWLLIKHRVMQQSKVHTSSKIEHLTLAAIRNITPHEWINEVERVKMVEKYYSNMDPLVEVQTAHLKAVKDAAGSTADADSDDQKEEVESNSESGLSEIEELDLATQMEVKPERKMNLN